MRCNSIRLLSMAVALGGCLTMVSVSVDAAFSTASFSIKRQSSALSMSMDNNFMENIPTLPNPFSKFRTPEPESGAGVMGSDPELIVAKAKAVLSCDLGVKDPSLLSEDFIWIGPTLEKPLGKIDYIAAGRFFNLQAAFPDFDYRAHDFRMDESDPLTIRITSRPTGTMLGALRLRTETVPPTGQPWRGPPEAISITFDADTGKVVKLCSGFSMDRFVGNTDGLTGVNAAATVAEKPPSDFEVLPITVAIFKLFGRPPPTFKESTALLAPFPETVMIQLVKGILAANLAADDLTLLAPEFVYCSPYVGPIKKKEFLQSYARQEFGGSEPELSHFRVDPFDPFRVWVDVKPVGPGFEGPPQAYSFTFDDDGFCTRMSAGAVMDPSIGNTGGLSGVEGIKYATGSASPSLVTRPLPLVLGRLRKKLLSAITNIDVDEYKLESSKTAPKDVFTPPKPKPKPNPPAAVKSPLQNIQKPAQKAQPRVVTSQEKPKPPVAQPKPDFFAATAKPSTLNEAPKPKPSGPSSAQKAQMAADQKNKMEEEKRADAAAKARQQRVAAQKALESTQLEAEQKKAAAEEEARRAAGQARKAAAQKLTLQAQEKEQAEVEARRQADQKNKMDEQKRADAAAKARQQRVAAQKSLERTQQEAEQKKAAAEEEARRAAGQARKAAAQKLTLQAEAKEQAKVEARRQAEESRRMAEERSRLAADARKEVAEQKKRELEEKKAAQAEAARVRAEEYNTAAERKRQEVAEKRADAELKRNEAEKRRKAAAKPVQKAAAKPVQPFFISGPRPTIPLSSILGGRPKKFDKAPAGVPTIVAWKLRRDGGITGQIFGSFNFKDGQRVETSEIASTGGIETGCVVTTDSGSRYFLSSESVKSMREASQKESSKNAPPKQMEGSKPRPTIRLTQLAKERDTKKALEAVEQGKPRSTFSLAGIFGFGDDDSKTEKSSSGAPQGVPSMGRWRENGDKSITGFISGSPTFAEGEQVTTSPIARGNISAGEVVVTKSGSKYFLK